MDKKKIICRLTFALGALALGLTTVSTCRLAATVRRLEAAAAAAPEPSAAIAVAEPPAPAAEAAVPVAPVPAPADKKEAAPAVPAVPPVMKVKQLAYNGQDCVTLTLSAVPDMAVVREYLSIDPAPVGKLAFRATQKWNWRMQKAEEQLVVTGDFLHRTNTVLRLRKGFPAAGEAAGAGVLAEDYVTTFSRNDKPPKLAFVDAGRYLPPVGRRALSISSLNLAKVRVEVRSMPSANIVPMLALDEQAYSKIIAHDWDEDEAFVEDLSRAPVVTVLTRENVPNVEEKTLLPLGPEQGVDGNGVYLVSLFDAAIDGRAWSNRSVFSDRLVCVSDLAISARTLPSGVFVWVTSLAQGTPVEAATVEVYSAANVLLAKGVTRADGCTVCREIEPGEPFAVVVTSADGTDRSFLALSSVMAMDESAAGANREQYLGEGDVSAFLWTERGIYRHDEPIFLQALLRTGEGRAPAPFPVELSLVSPLGAVYQTRTLLADGEGVLSCNDFSVGANQPSGLWKIRLRTPGKDGKVLGEREVKVEAFSLPQIRVSTQAATGVRPQDFSFTVRAEHLYGAPAKALACEGAVVFEDVPFSPAGWAGWTFGDEDRGLKPSFRPFARDTLDDSGAHVYSAPLWAASGKPKAAVRITAQGTVLEDGGRPATARDTIIAHYYPHYIGTTLTGWLRRPTTGRPVISVACVAPDGRRLGEARELTAKLERIEPVYTYRKGQDEAWATWDCEYVRETVVEGQIVTTSPTEAVALELPVTTSGDYVLTLVDAAADVSYARTFYVSDWGDDTIRAPLANPTAVTLVADRPFYRPGETPRLVVKAPFTGTALLTVLRDDLVYAKVLTLTNATSEVTLAPCTTEWAPNVDVKLSVVQSVRPGAKGFAARASGAATLVVRPPEREIPVTLQTAAVPAEGRVTVAVNAPGATRVTVTLVDEGINLLTGEPTPDPVAFFARPRTREARYGFYDLYHRVLPVFGEETLKANGVKTGGGFGAEMLGRVSPVATRRFKPLALWQRDIPVTDGRAEVTFALPEFVGEVRVTAVACSDRATGSASVRQKVTPLLVMEPDAPRFVAPSDTFRVTLPLANRSAAAGEVAYRMAAAAGPVIGEGRVTLAPGETTVVCAEVVAPVAPGQMTLVYTAEGFGERHEKTIELPVRPAVAWQETSGVERLEPAATWEMPRASADGSPVRFTYTVSGSQIGELRRSLEWLADYPHGCLEQTSSRLFPLLTADGVLAGVASVAASNRADYVKAGVARVESMVRENDFVMWPDCTYAPWDREVSLYAAHFLVEAERNGAKLTPRVRSRFIGFLEKWALSPTNEVSAYACHTLALAGKPNRDRMLRLYDERKSLDLLSRARLARAFVATADRVRARALVANADAPASVKEAAFLTLALVELDPDDVRLPRLVTYLLARRDRGNLTWGTTSENAHALLALASYYRVHPVTGGQPKVREVGGALANAGDAPAFVTWRRLVLPDPETVSPETAQLSIRRRYYKPDGKEPYDLAAAARGDLVIVELVLTSDVTRDYSDLVVEDLLPGAFEPVRAGLTDEATLRGQRQDWVMRSDARDDRMLVFSKKFRLEKGHDVVFRYPVRVVTAGRYALPGAVVEAMYQPGVRARSSTGRLVVRD